MWRRCGFAAAPVSRLFTERVCHNTYRVLIGTATTYPCEPVLVLARITPLRGRLNLCRRMPRRALSADS